ncbi:glycosyltransferase [Winogradskyella sp. 3972H.M.0a.05]|uniref:glycosyltransferase family 4 protein n=1 Tax=Winogradskyella sp. 3972H.M.0a.05 TaxID=2950277 RepID=UPI003396C69E
MNKKQTDVLLIGPLPDPITGASLGNKIVVDNLGNSGDYKMDSINMSYNKFDENIGVFSWSKLLFYLKFNFLAYKIFKSDKIYMVPGQTFLGISKYTIFIFLSKLLGKELIVHIHGNFVGRQYKLLKGFKKKYFKALLSKSNKGIVSSESLTHNMDSFIDNDKIHVLYNFLEDYLFLDQEQVEQKLQEKSLRIVYLSNLMEEKGIFDLLEALTLLEKNGIEYKAKIAGNIDERHRTRIESYFNKLRNAEYCGIVSGQSKKELFAWANVFVLPTFYTMEAQPFAIIEAMGTGSLIITTRHAGIPDIFEDKINGFYVDKQSASSIFDKLVKVKENPEDSTNIRRHNIEYAQSKYSVQNYIDNLTQILEA